MHESGRPFWTCGSVSPPELGTRPGSPVEARTIVNALESDAAETRCAATSGTHVIIESAVCCPWAGGRPSQQRRLLVSDLKRRRVNGSN
jgi:hypothetical protein